MRTFLTDRVMPGRSSDRSPARAGQLRWAVVPYRAVQRAGRTGSRSACSMIRPCRHRAAAARAARGPGPGAARADWARSLSTHAHHSHRTGIYERNATRMYKNRLHYTQLSEVILDKHIQYLPTTLSTQFNIPAVK